MIKTQIKKCICEHRFQDERYGPGMRVMNPTGKEGKNDTFRCTVCGLLQSKERAKDKPKDKK